MSQDKIKHNLFRSDLGVSHNDEHILWNRRQFLLTGGLAGLGSLFLSGMPLSPVWANQLNVPINAPGDENILVLIKMFGGNDGLNMVFPHSSAAGKTEYLNLRPTIGLKYGTDYNDNTVLSGFGASDYAIPNSMANLMPLWNEGKMAVLQNVGYPNQNYSHFASIDLWSTAASNTYDERIKSGVVGRLLDQEFPAFSEAPPTIPPALRIGYSTDAIFTAPGNQQMELVFNDPNEFFRLAQFGKLYETEGWGDCPQGQERSYLRALTNNSLRYSQSVTAAYNKTSNKVAYPTGTVSRLAEQMAIVSRLIKGRLGTRVYMVNIDGFDTHANQASYHPALMSSIANSVSAFYNDLKADNAQSNVSIVTYSEFGRTIRENGSLGTDHGNLSSLMMFGDGVNGGFYGSPIDLNDSQLKNGNTVVYYETQNSLDYRNMYASVLQEWMCVDPELVDFTMGEHYDRLNLFKNHACKDLMGSNANSVLLGHNPNALSARTIDIKFSQLHASKVGLHIKSINGKTLATLHDKYTQKGSYTVSLDPIKWKLPPGEYLYQLDGGGKSYIRRFNIF
ncbi:MAG: DUF1501 domain-containing protein [Bacteroidota bacterium]|nr:DUF1501 domain-containing protein [Bacteroidota bacterium]